MQPSEVAIPLGCLSLLVVVTNSCVCLLVYLHTKLRTYTNGFVVSLAVSDILTGALLLPLYITVPTFPGTGYVVGAILLTGVANVCAVTLDRYLAIVKPFTYYATMSRHFVKFIVGSWVLPLLISIIPLIWNSKPGLAHTVYMFLLQGLGVIVPYIFVCTAYYQIFNRARIIVRRLRRESSLSWRNHENKNKGRKNSNDMVSEAKVAKMFALIAISFILSWMPVIYLTSVISAVNNYDLVDKLSPVWLIDISLFTVALGSMVNPVIYSFFKPDFRSIIKRMLRKRTQRSSLKHSQTCVIDVALILKRLESGKDGKETNL
ncbi:octopamine receptor beta-2R-like [Oculina patagonica]